MSLELTEFASGLGFPEGPVAMDDGSIIFVDIMEEKLLRASPEGVVKKIADMPGGPNGAAIGPDGAAYVCNNGGVYTFVEYGPDKVHVPDPHRPKYTNGSIQRVDLETGEFTTLYDNFNGRKLIAPDDIVFDSHGGFYFTDTGLQDDLNIEKGALYYATIDGKTLKFVTQVPTANGVGLSPDGKKIYVSDTIFGRLWEMDVTGPGTIAPGPMPGIPGNVVQTLPKLQWLDSLKVEADGRICVGTIFNGGITIFTPEGAVEHVPVPDLFTTNLCFGGDDMRDVWITASSTGKIYKARWPRPGLKLNFTA